MVRSEDVKWPTRPKIESVNTSVGETPGSSTRPIQPRRTLGSNLQACGWLQLQETRRPAVHSEELLHGRKQTYSRGGCVN
jgi:hypothetical protein